MFNFEKGVWVTFSGWTGKSIRLRTYLSERWRRGAGKKEPHAKQPGPQPLGARSQPDPGGARTGGRGKGPETAAVLALFTRMCMRVCVRLPASLHRRPQVKTSHQKVKPWGEVTGLKQRSRTLQPKRLQGGKKGKAANL